jgi:hypothetical protein
MTRRLLPLCAACVLAFSACGGDSDEETSGSATPAATRTAAAAGNDFCDKTKANGASGASFGELQAWLPKAKLSSEVDEALGAMQGVAPPDEIAAAWNRRKQFLTRVKAALAKLPASGTLRAHPELVSNPAVTRASKAVTDYWFKACG